MAACRAPGSVVGVLVGGLGAGLLALGPIAARADEVNGRSLDIVDAAFATEIADVAAPFGFQYLSLDLRFANTGTTALDGVTLGAQCSLLEDGLFPYFAEQQTGPVDQSALWQPQSVAPQEGFDAALVFTVPEQRGALELTCDIGDAHFALPVSATAEDLAEAPDDDAHPDTGAEGVEETPEPEDPEVATEDAAPPQPDVTVTTDAETYAPGAPIVATVEGLPGNTQDWLTLVPADAEETTFGPWSFTNGATDGTFDFSAPDEPGSYEIRVYFDYPDGGFAVQARAPVLVEAPAPPPDPVEPDPVEPEPEPTEPAAVATLTTAATEYAPGSRFTADFTAPEGLPADAWVALVPADVPRDDAAASDASALDYRFLGGQTGGELPFLAPDAPGAYELRMFDSRTDGTELAAASVHIAAPAPPEPPAVEPALTLTAEEFAPGELVAVAFVAPADWPPQAGIALVPASAPEGDAGQILERIALAGATDGTLTFTAPAAGRYALRLDDGGGTVAATAAFDVTEPVVEPPAPDIALSVDRDAYEPGEPVVVSFAGLPGNDDDWLTLVEADAPDSGYNEWFYTEGAAEGTMTFTAPEPGAYEVRVLLAGSSDAVAARLPVRVEAPPEPPAPDIVLGVDREVYRPGQPVVVSFAGLPGNEDDWLTMVEADAPDNGYNEWFYTEGAAEGTMTFTAPEPGAYEVRVLLAGSSDAVSARLPVRVEGPPEPPVPSATPGLSLAQEVFAPGEPFIIGFAAPADFPDEAWIGLLPAEVPHGSEAINADHDLAWQFIGEARTGQLEFTAPDTPGRYDLRLSDGDHPGALEVASVAFAVSADGTPPEPDPAPVRDRLATPDAPVNVAAAPFGTRVLGASRPGFVNDGDTERYDNADGYAHAGVGTPIIVDLGRTRTIERLRMLLWDGDDRFYRYRIDGSADGTGWQVLADRSSGEHRSWQEVALADMPLRYIRVVGLHNSANADFHIVELEAYSREPLPFTRLAEPVGDESVPIGRDLAFSVLGGRVVQAPESTDAAEALNDGIVGTGGWTAAAAGTRQDVTVAFYRDQAGLIEAVALRATPGEDGTHPRVVELAVETGRVLNPWTVIGRYGLPPTVGWHLLSFDPVEADRVRVSVLSGYDDDLPVTLDEIAVLEGTAEGYQSILPGRHPDFAGGPNIALAALGGRIERASETQGDFWAESLIDGRLGRQGNWGWYTPDAAMPKEIVVSFRDGREAMIGGVSLNADAGFNTWHSIESAVRVFEVWTSTTGPDRGFTQVGTFLMDKAVGWQTFSFEPVPARYVMLRILQNHGAEEVSLGELEVLEAVAPSYRSILADDPPNLALPALGGHFAVPHGHNRLSLIDDIPDNDAWTVEDGAAPPVDFALAFRDQRSAVVDSITVTPPAQLEPEDWVREIKVSVSTDSPLSGFETVGTFTIAPQRRAQSFSFPPVEARYVQVRVLSNGGGRRYALGGFAVHERLEPGTLSVLSRLPSDSEGLPVREPAPSLPDEPEPNDSVADATPIAPGETREGLIAPPTDEDVYRLDTRAEPYPGITVTLEESPVLRVGLELLDSRGQPIDQQPLYERVGDRATLTWQVPQDVYHLRVSRPLTSVVVQSDLSPSTDPVRADITRALNAFVAQMTEFERVSVAGFCGDIDQASDFTSDPATLSAAVEEINYGCGGTALYRAMHDSLDWLAPQQGGRAILAITDAEDTGNHGQELHALWQRLGTAGARVYGVGFGDAIRYQIGDGALGSTGADLLRSWAAATGGRYFDAPSGDAINEVMALIADELRRPSLYRLTVATPQGEGGLSVVEVGESIAGVAAPARVSLIFDASGSMWGRDETGTPKIEIARQVMRAVINGVPEQMQVGLRIYGHRYPREPKARSCTDSELVVPFGPLDRDRLIGTIDGLNPQGQTPIGLSLAGLREDFAGVEGQKVVIVVTDGIETCDPDPGDPNYPPAVVQQLLAEGMEVKVNVVGFGIEESRTRDFLRQISDLSGGQYFDAADATQLQAALEDAIRADFAVTDARGETVATGQVNDPPAMLAEGVYAVEVAADPPILAEVAVAIDEETRVLLNKEGESVGVEVETRDLALAATEPAPEPAETDDTTGTSSGATLPPAASLDAETLVREIQSALGARGYDPGPADGVIGSGTRDAIRAYQADAGLPVDGLATAALLEDLRSRPAGATDTAASGNPPDSGSTITSAGPADRVSYFGTPRTMFAAQSAARIRSGPGTNHDQVGSIPFGGQVTVLGELEGWYYLETANGVRGFTAASLLSSTRPAISSGRTSPPSSTGTGGPPPGPGVLPSCPPGETPIEVSPGRYICARLQ